PQLAAPPYDTPHREARFRQQRERRIHRRGVAGKLMRPAQADDRQQPRFLPHLYVELESRSEPADEAVTRHRVIGQVCGAGAGFGPGILPVTLRGNAGKGTHDGIEPGAAGDLDRRADLQARPKTPAVVLAACRAGRRADDDVAALLGIMAATHERTVKADTPVLQPAIQAQEAGLGTGIAPIVVDIGTAADIAEGYAGGDALGLDAEIQTAGKAARTAVRAGDTLLRIHGAETAKHADPGAVIAARGAIAGGDAAAPAIVGRIARGAEPHRCACARHGGIVVQDR